MSLRSGSLGFAHVPCLLFVLLLMFTAIPQVHARIGCAYEDIKAISDLVSKTTAEKYVGWVCDGEFPEEPSPEQKLNHPKQGEPGAQTGMETNILGFEGVDSLHLEYGPLGLFGSGEGNLDVYYRFLDESRIAFGIGAIKLGGTFSLSTLFVSGGYRFHIEGIGDAVPQLRYGRNLGFQAAIPFTVQFGAFTTGATFKFWESVSLGLHGGYKF